MGEFEEAERAYQSTLAMLKGLHSPEQHPDGHPDQAMVLVNLAGLYKKTGQFDSSLQAVQEVLRQAEALYPPGPIPTAIR